MNLKRFIYACSLSLLACLIASSVSLAGETINFGMGRMLDSSRSPEIDYGFVHDPHPTGLLEVNGKLYAFWQEGYFEEEPFDLVFSTSEDYGNTWTNRNEVAMESSYAAAVAADGDGNIHAVSGWPSSHQVKGFDYGIYDTAASDWSFQSYSSTCFAQYSACCTTSCYKRFSMQYNPADDNIYMVAVSGDLYCGDLEIYEIEGGVVTMMPPPDLQACQSVNYAEMCIDNNGLIYLFVGGGDPLQLYLWREGSGWEGPVVTLENVGAGSICAKSGPDGRVFLAWEHGDRHDTYLTSFIDGQPHGPTEPVRVDDNFSRDVADAQHQDIFFGPLDAQNHYDIYVVVYEGRFTAYDCYPPDMIYRSTDEGKSFGKGWRITWGDYNSACPVDPKGIVTTDGGGNEKIVVFWEDDRIFDPSHQLYYSIGKVYPDNPSVLLVSDDYSETPSPYWGNHLTWETHDSVIGEPIPEFIQGHNYHNYEAWYADALFNNNIPYDFYDIAGERRLPELAYLKKFKALVWETGLEHKDAQVDPGYNTLTTGEQDLLSGYLDWGGKLFLCSQNFLSDAKDQSGTLNNTFANDYLSVTYSYDDLDGGNTYSAADPNYDVHTSNMQLREYTENPLQFFDDINTPGLTIAGDAEELFSFNGYTVGLRKSAANYSLVYLGFPFETIDQYAPGTTSATRDDVMGWVMGLLEDSQGYIVSKNPDFSTSDTYFASGDTMYVAVWSDRVTYDEYTEAYFTIDGGNPVNMSHSQTLGGRALECYTGSINFSGGQKGDLTISEITLRDGAGKEYTITGRPISVGLKVDVFNPANLEMPIISPYPVNLHIRCEGGNTVLVSPYYYDIEYPDTKIPIENESSVQVNGEANISVAFDLSGLTVGHSYGICVEAKIKTGNVNSSGYSTGHLDIVDTYAPPTSTINSPQNSSVKNSGLPSLDISGNATYASNSEMLLVQVSTDGGATWNGAAPYNGNWDNWSYTWNSPPDGYWNIRSRAIDIYGNVEDPGAGVSVYIGVDKIYKANVDSAGNQCGGSGPEISVSSDGRYVAFTSEDPSLVPNDTNGVADVFVHDRMTGITERVSMAYDNSECNDFCNSPCISADGRYVVFTSYANNLVSGDTNNSEDVFIRDRMYYTTKRVSVTTSGAQVSSYSWSSLNCISADGRYVVFHSDSGEYDPSDNNQVDDVFVRDLIDTSTTRVSLDSNGNEGSGESAEAAISSDGRYVVFKSGAALDPNDTNSTYDIYVRDTQNDNTSRVSVALDGSDANGESYLSYSRVITPDGRYVLFASYASNLVAGDNNGDVDLFLRDRVAGTTELVSVATDGSQGANYWINGFSLSDDARYAVFSSYASNLVAGDTNGRPDIFVRDRQTTDTLRLNMPDDVTEANGDSAAPCITAEGRYVAFVSGADNLVPDDTNAMDDVFIVGNKAFFQ